MMSGEVHCSGDTSNKLLPYGLLFYSVPESVSLCILASLEHYEPPAPAPLVLGPQLVSASLIYYGIFFMVQEETRNR